MYNTTMVDMKKYMLDLGRAAQKAAVENRCATTEQKNIALMAIGEEILKSRDFLMRLSHPDRKTAQCLSRKETS